VGLINSFHLVHLFHLVSVNHRARRSLRLDDKRLTKMHN